MLRILNDIILKSIVLFYCFPFTLTLFGVSVIGTHFINDKIENPMGLVLYTGIPALRIIKTSLG